MNDREPTVQPGLPEDASIDAASPDDGPVIAGGEGPAGAAAGGVAAGGDEPIEPVEEAVPVDEPGSRADAAGAAPAAPRPMSRVLGYLAAAVGGGLLVGSLLVAAGALGGGGADPSPAASPTAAPSASASAAPSASPSAAPTAGPGFVSGQTVGWASAPVTIEIWADYQCPFCKLEAFAFGGALEREYAGSGRAKIVFRDYAFLDSGSTAKESQDAAVAARCAGRQDPGAYWRYHDLLFLQQQGENQGAFSRDNLVGLAGIAGLDTAAFTSCLDDPAVRSAVLAETAEGAAQGIGSTPTTVVTGPGPTQVLRGFTRDWSELVDAIERASDPAATPTPTPAPPATPSPTPTAEASAGESPGGTATPSPEPSPSPSP